MPTAIFLLACLACGGHARRVLGNSPDAAFMPSGQGARFPVKYTARASSRPVMQSELNVKEMSGITEPMGFFDPLGFSEGISAGRLRFYREVELKHGRLGMLAALGIVVAEQWHPLFGGDIETPAYRAFQQTPLEEFWGLVVGSIAIAEVYSVFTFNNPAGGEPWSIREDHKEGDYLFDPLKLAPEDKEEFKQMRNKELNNGRLAMIAAAGMIAQELATGETLF